FDLLAVDDDAVDLGAAKVYSDPGHGLEAKGSGCGGGAAAQAVAGDALGQHREVRLDARILGELAVRAVNRLLDGVDWRAVEVGGQLFDDLIHTGPRARHRKFGHSRVPPLLT